MCGIAGKLSTNDPIQPELIDSMCETIHHRGPDGRGAFVEAGVGLGIQRLAVIDLATGDQPIFNEDESVVIVLNGEIYNYRELCADLERRGHTLKTASDTETIVHLYEEYGDDCVEHLRGMFAFALWDKRERRLLLARDRLGKKPLFYAEKDGCLWFASEPRAILVDPAIPRDADIDAIDSFLQFQYVPHPRSAFAALRKLPPAHVLSWRDGRSETRRYWRLSYRDGQWRDENEMREALRTGLLEATALRLRSDVPVGAFLSGGVDSSAIVAAMAQQTDRVRTFAIGFDVAEFDETAIARQVAELFGTEHQEFHVDADAMALLPDLVWHYGEPFADQSAIPSFYLAELARRHVTVALNGDGGDENFAGYRHYLHQEWARRLASLPSGMWNLAGKVAETPRVGASGPGRKFGKLVRSMPLSVPDRTAMWVSYFTRSDLDRLYEPDVLASLGERTADRWITSVYETSDAPTPIERLLDIDVNTYLPGDLLVKMDVATMAHSLEVRSPLLDHVFMETVASMPALAKLRGRRSKHLFKKMLSEWLPPDVLNRRKMGFGVPLDHWFRNRLKGLPAEVLLDPVAANRGLFRRSEIERLVAGQLAGTANNGNKLWALLQLELWFRTYVDTTADAPLALSV